jgi:hypothetical protein
MSYMPTLGLGSAWKACTSSWVRPARRPRRHATLAILALLAAGALVPAQAQQPARLGAQGTSPPPADAHVPLEWLALVPVLRIGHIGWDDNVFHESEAEGPRSDFTATITPALDAWVRLPGGLVRSRSQFDYVYFRELSQIRSIDPINSVHAEMLLNRVVPYISASLESRRHREYDRFAFDRGPGPEPGLFEIDDPIRRRRWGWVAGVDVRLTGKTSVGAYTRRTHVTYTGNTIYRGVDLARYLAADGRADGVRLRYALTPYTTIGADLERHETTFTRVPERNSDGLSLTSTVSFAPLAAVNGYASVGTRRRTFVDGDAQTFDGFVASVGLGYTLLGRTRFMLNAHRDLAYSYRADYRDYLETGVDLAVMHRLGTTWDVRGTIGRFRMTYDFDEPARPGGSAETERLMRYGVDVGRHIRRARVGFQVLHQTRASAAGPGRGYDRTRIGSSITYRF